MNDWKEHIRIDPKICHGQPCIKGTRIMVWLVVECLANGDTEKEIQAAYPALTRKDIRAALAYAAELTKERVLPVNVHGVA
jgi:uncharacterized protein (DUF433 family)